MVIAQTCKNKKGATLARCRSQRREARRRSFQKMKATNFSVAVAFKIEILMADYTKSESEKQVIHPPVSRCVWHQPLGHQAKCPYEYNVVFACRSIAFAQHDQFDPAWQFRLQRLQKPCAYCQMRSVTDYSYRRPCCGYYVLGQGLCVVPLHPCTHSRESRGHCFKPGCVSAYWYLSMLVRNLE